MRLSPILKRGGMVLVAFVTGWVVYMVAMMVTVYDGALSLILQPFMAGICSAVVVLGAWIAGKLFRIQLFGRIWRSNSRWALSLIVLSLFLMCFGSMIGLTSSYVIPETGKPFTALNAHVALGSYFALLFALVNYPLKSDAA